MHSAEGRYFSAGGKVGRLIRNLRLGRSRSGWLYITSISGSGSGHKFGRRMLAGPDVNKLEPNMTAPLTDSGKKALILIAQGTEEIELYIKPRWV